MSEFAGYASRLEAAPKVEVPEPIAAPAPQVGQRTRVDSEGFGPKTTSAAASTGGQVAEPAQVCTPEDALSFGPPARVAAPSLIYGPPVPKRNGPPAPAVAVQPASAKRADYRTDSVFEINVEAGPEVRAVCQFKVKRNNSVAQAKGQLGDTTYEAKFLAAQRKAITVGRGKFIASLGDFTMSLLKTGSKTSLWPGVAVTTEFEPIKFDLKKMELSLGTFSLGLAGDITSFFFPDGSTTTKIEITGKLTVTIEKVDWRSIIKAAEFLQQAKRDAAAAAKLARQARALEAEIAAARARGGVRATKLLRGLQRRLANVVQRSKLLRQSLGAIEKKLAPLLASLKGTAAKLAGSEIAIFAAKIIGRALSALNVLLVILDVIDISRYAYAAVKGAAHWQWGGGGSFANADANGVAGGEGGSGNRGIVNGAPKAAVPTAHVSDGAAPVVNGKGTGVGNGGGDSDGIGANGLGVHGPGDDSGVYTTADQAAPLHVEQISAVPTYGVATGVDVADEESTGPGTDPSTNVSRPGDDVGRAPAGGTVSNNSESGAVGSGAGTDKGASIGDPSGTGQGFAGGRESSVERAESGPAMDDCVTNGQMPDEAGVGDEAATAANAGAGSLAAVDVGIGSQVRGSSVTSASSTDAKTVEAKPKVKPTATPTPPPKKPAKVTSVGGDGLTPTFYSDGRVTLSAAQLHAWVKVDGANAKISDAALAWKDTKIDHLFGPIQFKAAKVGGSVVQGDSDRYLVNISISTIRNGSHEAKPSRFRFEYRPKAAANEHVGIPRRIDLSPMTSLVRKIAVGIFTLDLDRPVELHGFRVLVKTAKQNPLVDKQVPTAEFNVTLEVLAVDANQPSTWLGQKVELGAHLKGTISVPLPLQL